MSLHPAQTDHALLAAELIRGWRRSETKLSVLTLPDPLKDSSDGDIDELSPIFVRGQQFDTAKDDDVAPFTAQQVAGEDDGTGGILPGTGYLIVKAGPEGPALPSSSPGNPGIEDRTVPFEARICVPAVGGYGLATLYGSALTLIFSGISISPPGDPYAYCITNIARPPGEPTFISDDSFTAEFRWVAQFTRTAFTTVAGTAPVPLMEESGRVVLDDKGVPIYD